MTEEQISKLAISVFQVDGSVKEIKGGLRVSFVKEMKSFERVTESEEKANESKNNNWTETLTSGQIQEGIAKRGIAKRWI